ncbi:MAG: cell wall hydrolase [Sphingomonas bacterium]|nr:cell wall hydrolase [Sphingomonas bacterium]
MTRGAAAIGVIALTASCVAPGAGDTGVGEYRVSIAVPPPAPHDAGEMAGPSAALLAEAPAATLEDALIVTPSRPFVENAAAPDAQRALDCLTQAVYYEARSESEDGQRAVAQVVLNRVRNPAYSNSVCGTVYEGSRRATGCQFSFTCDGSLNRRREPTAWSRAAQVAADALSGYVYAPVGTATYYHTAAVNPSWAARVTRVATIGAHLFYRLPGSWGGIDAFKQRYAGSEPVLTAGRHIAPKSVEEIIRTIAGSVTVHRGSLAGMSEGLAESAQTTAAVTPPPSLVSGVRIHRGVAPAKAIDHGVTIHRGVVAPELATR